MSSMDNEEDMIPILAPGGVEERGRPRVILHSRRRTTTTKIKMRRGDC
jgi:hypothetical protein